MYDIKPWIKTISVIFSLLDQLKGKINLNVDDMDKLTVDDLRSQVDYAISQVILQGKYVNGYQGLSFHLQ
jgi:ABC-type proline/glycine betaine transport system ATPase subunit